jgi:hypothetical protein
MHRPVLVITLLAFSLVACSSDSGMSSGNGGSTGITGTGGALPGTGGNLIDIHDDAGISTVGTGGVVSGTGGAIVTGVGGALVATGGATAIALGGSGGQIDAAAGGAGAAIDGGTAGEAGNVGCDQDLSGTWDLFATSLGTGIVRGVLTVKKEGFSLSTSSALLTFDAESPSATWKYTIPWSGQTSTRAISVQSTPAAANTGSFPIALGGHWVLQSASETCTLDVAADKVTGKCTGRAGDHNVGGEDWPWELMDPPENRLTYTIARSQAAVSQFGDFGGSWTARSDSGSGQGCDIKLEGNTATTSCRASNSFNGTLHLTIGADCVASGMTPSGLEVSARRR